MRLSLHSNSEFSYYQFNLKALQIFLQIRTARKYSLILFLQVFTIIGINQNALTAEDESFVTPIKVTAVESLKRFFSFGSDEFASTKDFVDGGYATPTVYYIPTITDEDNVCKKNEKVQVWGLTEDNKVKESIKLCRKQFNNCTMQGSCLVMINNKYYPINFQQQTDGKIIFTQFPLDVCPFGLGAGMTCLDPFKSVAADLTKYKLGTVLYFPKLKGLYYGMDKPHDGYVIVRDSGGAINGAGRFDFFSGYTNWKDQNNYFANAGLGDKTNKMKFYIARGKTAEAVRASRNYPGVPNFDYDRSELVR